MYTDNIIEDVWKNRESYVNQHHHNMDEIVNDLINRQKHSGRNIVNRYKAPNKNMHSDKLELPRSVISCRPR